MGRSENHMVIIKVVKRICVPIEIKTQLELMIILKLTYSMDRIPSRNMDIGRKQWNLVMFLPSTPIRQNSEDTNSLHFSLKIIEVFKTV